MDAAETVNTALTSDQITGVGIGTIAAIVVVALVIGLIVTKVVVRVVLVVVVIALGTVVWTQRGAVLDAAQDAAKRCSATFFGIHVQPSSPAGREACKDVTNR